MTHHNSIATSFWLFRKFAVFPLIGAPLALAHKLFHARDLDFDAFAEILNPGKGGLENEFAAIVAVNRIGVAHAGSSGLARLAVERVDIDPVEGGQNVLPAETIRTGWPDIGNAIRTDNGTYAVVVDGAENVPEATEEEKDSKEGKDNTHDGENGVERGRGAGRVRRKRGRRRLKKQVEEGQVCREQRVAEDGESEPDPQDGEGHQEQTSDNA